jgi:hypothetical protein
MQPQSLKPVNGNRALACFIISLPLTTAILIVIINGPTMIVSMGLPLYVMAVGVVIFGLVSGIRAHRLGEEKFRYQFALYFNVTMLFCLLVMLAMFFFVRAEVPGMM